MAIEVERYEDAVEVEVVRVTEDNVGEAAGWAAGRIPGATATRSADGSSMALSYRGAIHYLRPGSCVVVRAPGTRRVELNVVEHPPSGLRPAVVAPPPLEVKRYRRPAREVEVVEVTATNRERLVEWFRGRGMTAHAVGMGLLLRPSPGRLQHAPTGSFVVVHEGGAAYVMSRIPETYEEVAG